MINAKILGVVVAAFAAGAFVASPVPQAIAAVIATDVQCTGCVGASDMSNNAVTAAKIKDAEVKAADIATDAVGAAEIVGVTKLLFGQCNPASPYDTQPVSPGSGLFVSCNISGVDTDDSVIATYRGGSLCFGVAEASPVSGAASVLLHNRCSSQASIGDAARIAVIVYDK